MTVEKLYALFAILAFVAFWGWLRFRRESTQSQRLLEAQKQLLDKLGSTSDLSQFLSSAEGRAFMDGLKPPTPPPALPPSRPPTPAEILFVMIWGAVVMIGVGAGLYVGAIWVEPKLLVPAAVVAFAGVAVLVGLMITHALAKRWGMVKVDTDGQLVDCRKPIE